MSGTSSVLNSIHVVGPPTCPPLGSVVNVTNEPPVDSV